MDNIENIMRLRYLKVTEGLLDNWFVKAVLSLLATAWATITDILYIEPTLLAACIIATLLDYYTGIRNSKKRKIEISSFGYRQLGAKITEFGVVIIFFTLASTTFGEVEGNSWITILLHELRHIHYFAYFWVFWTEGKSILENIGGKDSRYHEIWELVKNKLFKHIDE